MAGLSATGPAVEPGSTHVSDPALRPFLQANFDPADYLNATLPSLLLSSVSSRPLKQGVSSSLADLSTQTQDLLSQLNAHTTRLSTVLTQLTDDILRSGGRLAYEVEVLRGETIGLSESLTEGLKADVDKFLPGGIFPEADAPEDGAQNPVAEEPAAKETEKAAQDGATPSYISELRTLSTIRGRLETVIKVFGEAMHWTLPPSEISLTSSLISVSAPDPNSSGDQERKGREFASQLRSEISDLITGDEAGPEAALMRIQALRDLATLWKGTAEEKSRTKFVDSLVKLVEERQKALEKETAQRQRTGRASVAQKPAPPTQKTGGFLDNLSRLRGNIYADK